MHAHTCTHTQRAMSWKSVSSTQTCVAGAVCTVKMEDMVSSGGKNDGNYKKLYCQEDGSEDEQPSSSEQGQQQGTHTRLHTFPRGYLGLSNTGDGIKKKESPELQFYTVIKPV